MAFTAHGPTSNCRGAPPIRGGHGTAPETTAWTGFGLVPLDALSSDGCIPTSDSKACSPRPRAVPSDLAPTPWCGTGRPRARRRSATPPDRRGPDNIAEHGTRTIGSLTVSVVGLGCNNFGRRIDEARPQRVVDAALDAGMTFFDTADIYGGTASEEFLGRALGGAASGRARHEVRHEVDAGQGRRGARVRARARRGQPRAAAARTASTSTSCISPTPPCRSRTRSARWTRLVATGKVREIGCSNFSAAQLARGAEAGPRARPRFVSVQNELSLLDARREADGLPARARAGSRIIPYFPLASGLLTGKYRRGRPPPARPGLSVLDENGSSDEELDPVENARALRRGSGARRCRAGIGGSSRSAPVASVITGATKPKRSRGTWPRWTCAPVGRGAGRRRRTRARARSRPTPKKAR